VLFVCSLFACNSTGGESTLDECSNGRDDDSDGMADCTDPACRGYSFCSGGDAGQGDGGPRDAAPRPDGAACGRTIDLVVVADVSSSMVTSLERLAAESSAIVDAMRALDPDAAVSLVVFVDDALAVNDCAPFADGAALATEIAAWRTRAPNNRSPVSATYNQDCAENSLDALSRAATECPWREGAARMILHVTDDTFAERPTVLSGPWGGGIVVQHTYPETVDQLAAAGAHVVALTRNGTGHDCGAAISPDVGQGFQTPYQDMPAIPARTAGIALDLDVWNEGGIDLATTLADLAESACQ
jgi:hypothetical protein